MCDQHKHAHIENSSHIHTMESAPGLQRTASRFSCEEGDWIPGSPLEEKTGALLKNPCALKVILQLIKTAGFFLISPSSFHEKSVDTGTNDTHRLVIQTDNTHRLMTLMIHTN